MSVNALELDQSAIDNSNIGPWKFTQEVLANRPYQFFGVIKTSAEALGHGFNIANGVLQPIYTGLSRVGNTENLIYFFQGVAAFPEQIQGLSNKVSGWWNGSDTFLSLANQTRKFAAHTLSTVGDYAEGCSALASLNVNVGSINIVSERVGNLGSALGSLSRIADYMSGDVSSKAPHNLKPSLEKVRQPIAESKNMWELARDISIFSLSSLCLGFGGFGAIPLVFAIGLPGSILGTKMVAYYREVQLKAIDASHPQIDASKKILKAS